ncbi:hypothetical protein GA0115256_12421, partial [Streptomyces sp. DconLS]
AGMRLAVDYRRGDAGSVRGDAGRPAAVGQAHA